MKLWMRWQQKFKGTRDGTRRKLARRGFTLVEILVVVTIIMVLAAIIFPVFSRLKEAGRQAHCVSNLHEIGLAVQQYYQDEKAYPTRLADLVSIGPALVESTGGNGKSPPVGPPIGPPPIGPPPIGPPIGPPPIAPPGDPDLTSASLQINGGYLQSPASLLCPDDGTESDDLHSSYGTLWLSKSSDTAPPRSVWNYYGYDQDGFNFADARQAAIATTAPGGASLLLYPGRPYHATSNPIKNSLSNRFVPWNAVITHCRYHRLSTSSLQDPDQVYDNAAGAAGARDILLRVDGSAASRNIAGFKTTNQWQKQYF